MMSKNDILILILLFGICLIGLRQNIGNVSYVDPIWKGVEEQLKIVRTDVEFSSACSYYEAGSNEISLTNAALKSISISDKNTDGYSSGIKNVVGSISGGKWEFEINESYDCSYMLHYPNITCWSEDVYNISYYEEPVIVEYCTDNGHDELIKKTCWNLKWVKGVDFETEIGIGETQQVRYCANIEREPTNEGWTISVDHIPEFGGISYEQWAWWNSSWEYRTNFIITENANGGDLTDYQVKIEANTSAFTDFNIGGIRFTNSTDDEIDFWVEETNSTPTGNFTAWVEVPTIPNASTETVYMYYGNTSVVSDASNGTATFKFFDDFEDALQGDWTTVFGSPDYSSTAQSYKGSQSLEMGQDESTKLAWSHGEDYSILVWARYSSGKGIQMPTHGDDTKCTYWRVEGGDIDYSDGAWQDTGYDQTHDEWFRSETRDFDFTLYTYDIVMWKNETTVADDISMASIASYQDVIHLASRVAASTVYCDDVIIRSFTKPEPTYSQGSEETDEGTTAPTWQNQGQSDSTPVLGDSVTLYVQGKDETALDWAWLATNETGSWVNESQSGKGNIYYQETADSTSYSGNPVYPSYMQDGNWNSYSYDAGGGGPSYHNSNYTKKSISRTLSLWKIKGGVNLVNLSFGSSCWDYHSDILQLRAKSYDSGGGATQYSHAWECYDGSWQHVYGAGSVTPNIMYVYEEAVWWQLYGLYDMQDVADTWTWSNFTWDNSSVSEGQVIGWRIYYNDTSGNENATDIMTFTINSVPTITSVADTPDPQIWGGDVQFSVDWNDADGEGTKMLICKSNSITTSTTPTCPGGEWCSNKNDYDMTDPILCSYTTLSGDIGSNNYWGFVCDDAPTCSAGEAGSFTVNKKASSCTLTSSATWSYTYGTATTLGCSCTGDGTKHLYFNGVEHDEYIDASMTFAAQTSTPVICNITEGTTYYSATDSNSLTISKATPTGHQTAAPSWTETYGTETTITCYQDSGDSGTTLTLKRDAVTKDTGVQPSEQITLGYKSGGYSYTCHYPSTENYTVTTLDTDTLTINKATSVLSGSVTSPITYETASDYTGSESNSGGDGDCTYILLRNGSQIDTGSSVSDSTVLGASVYNYTYHNAICTNWTAGSDYNALTVNTKNANVQVYPITQTITYGTSVTQYCTDAATLLDCSNYRNGSNISNNTGITLGTGYYEYKANISDYTNYTNYLDLENLTINKAPTSTILYLNGSSSDRWYELGSPVNITGDCNVSLLVSLTINATGKRTDYTSGTGSVTDEFDTYASEYKLNDSSTAKNLTYAAAGNQSVWISLPADIELQYAYWNLTGFESGGNYPINVRIYVNDTESNYIIGQLRETEQSLDELNDSSTSYNITFNQAESNTVYVRIPKNANVTSAQLNLTGFELASIEEDEEDGYTCIKTINCHRMVDEDWSTFGRPSKAATPTYKRFMVEEWNVTSTTANITVRVYVENLAYAEYEMQCKNISSGTYYDIFTLSDTGVINKTISINSDCLSGSTLYIGHVAPSISNIYMPWLYESLITWIGPWDITDPHLDVGGDGSSEWSYSGEFNQSVSPDTAQALASAMNSYLTVCTQDADGNCNIPLVFYSDNPGILQIDAIEINYTINFNPISLDYTLIQEYLDASSGTVNIPINISSTSTGIIQIDGINISFYGDIVYNVTASVGDENYTSSSDTQYVKIAWSNCSLELPSGVDYWEIFPNSYNQKNITPYGQTSTTPIWNLTSYANENFSVSIKLNESLNSCINVTYSNTSSKDDGHILTTSDQVFYRNITTDSSATFFSWTDLFSCNYTAIRYAIFEFIFTPCCDRCLWNC